MTSTYGSRIKAGRRAMGLTQDELAAKLDLSRSSVANIERDHQRSLIDDVARYAEVLRVDPGWLAFGRVSVEGRPPPKPRTVSAVDLVAVSNDLQRIAVRVMGLSRVANSEEVVEVTLSSSWEPLAGSSTSPTATKE